MNEKIKKVWDLALQVTATCMLRGVIETNNYQIKIKKNGSRRLK